MPAQSHLVLQLPGGLVVDGRTVRTAELQPLTGVQEDWLAHHPDEPDAVAVTRVLSDCLLRVNGVPSSAELAGRLLVGDRDFLMLQLRRLTLGDRVQAVVECPDCRSKADVDFRISEIPIDARPQSATEYTIEVGESKRSVRFRLPTGRDQAAVAHLPTEQAAEALFGLCLLDDGGSELGDSERSAIIDAMEERAPKAEIDLDVTCPHCEMAYSVPFDITAFFFREMRLAGRELLREVHFLAFYYHWSEAEILRLERSRRRAYLDLLSETLRTD